MVTDDDMCDLSIQKVVRGPTFLHASSAPEVERLIDATVSYHRRSRTYLYANTNNLLRIFIFIILPDYFSSRSYGTCGIYSRINLQRSCRDAFTRGCSLMTVIILREAPTRSRRFYNTPYLTLSDYGCKFRLK